MGQDYSVDTPGIEGQVTVAFKGLRATALEQTTIQKMRFPLTSMRCWEPVTARAAPQNVISISLPSKDSAWRAAASDTVSHM